MLSGLKSGGGGWGLCARSYTHLAYISPTRTHPRGWIVHERAGQTLRNVFMRGPRVWTHFRYRFPAISEMTIRPPRPTKRVHAGQRERERERTANLSLAALGILRGEEEGEGEKERERGASFWKGAPFDEARPLPPPPPPPRGSRARTDTFKVN